jgi:uncharacterized Tic20 family protein
MATPETASPVVSSDERIMAALAHISAMLPTIGIIAAIIIWVTQKDKSRYVYFQALQAIVYHLVLILGWFLTVGCYMLSAFGVIAFTPLANDSSVPFLMGGMLLPFLVIGLAVLLWLAYIIYAIVATVLTFQGKEFRYLVIGNLIERAMQAK